MQNDLGALMLWIDRKLNRNQDVLVTKIDSIQNLFETSAEATASSADVLEGKTAYNGIALITGTMENQGAKEATLLAGGHTISRVDSMMGQGGLRRQILPARRRGQLEQVGYWKG